MEEYSPMTVGNKTDLVSDSDNATTTAQWKRMPCVSSTSSFCPRICDLPAAVQQHQLTRDWLPARVVNGSDDYEMCVHTIGNLNPDTSQSEGFILLDETSTAHATPDADGDPEVDTDTSVPTIMIPPLTSSIDLGSHHHKRTSKSRSCNSQLQLRGARRHAWLDPQGLHPLPHSRLLLFRWGPRRTIRIRALLPTSRVLAPLRSPLRIYMLIKIDPARLGDACSLRRRYRYPPHPRSHQRDTSRRKP
ncbi:hypothetical protein BGW80DRAFT_613261 [Lactifluus volemus]|nr:hypothetical protein BGW80DRAFT_613261 [Lactifluus volemus]